MSVQHSLSDRNLMKSWRKKLVNICEIQFRLLVTCTFSSLFVFTPAPHPANHTPARGPLVWWQSLETEESMTFAISKLLVYFQMTQMPFDRTFLQLWLFWMGWMAAMPGVAVSTSQLCSCSLNSPPPAPAAAGGPDLPPPPPPLRWFPSKSHPNIPSICVL